MPTLRYSEIAARLLRDAAGFFRTLGEQNPQLRAQMNDNAGVFDHFANMVEHDPTGTLTMEKNSVILQRLQTVYAGGGALPQATYGMIAVLLLRDAAGVFRTIAEQNKPLAGQMGESIDIFQQIAGLLETDPEGSIETD